MRRFASVVLIALCLCTAARAQQTTQDFTDSDAHVIGMDVGINQVKDENLLPRTHAGFILRPSYEYRRGGDARSVLRIALGYGRMGATPEPLQISAHAETDISYEWGFPVMKGSNFMVYAGPQARLHYSVSYFPSWDDSHLYWANTLSADASGALLIAPGKNKLLIATLSLPLITAYSRSEFRPAHKIDDISVGGILEGLHSNVHAGFWDRAFRLRFSAEYQFPISDNLREAIVYEFNFLRVEAPGGLPYLELSHSLGLKVQL